ncbi:hypothetical protein [Lacipirellula limnantheis]|uniref:hypothetical protein n=1 Tax=Lacipirellula limnantheis TaxID=2528024 RepID=UPI0011A53C67|nr:hypothetical protein [Lacipirellula limnantheis]
MVYLGSVIAIAGAASGILGWALFRLPGVRVLSYAPIWRLPRLVSPTGLKIIAVGEVVMIVGEIVMFLQLFSIIEAEPSIP